MNSPLPDTYTETLTLLERRDESPGIFTYVLHPHNPVPFEAGQYAHVRLFNMPEDARRVHEFSFASAPQDSDIWFGIDARSGSEYQQALQKLIPGDTVELFKIRSHVTWPPPVEDIVMIAGGVGVTPFRSMVRDARQKNIPLTVTLIHAASGFYLYQEEMRELANDYIATNRAGLTDALSHVAENHSQAHYYVAGSPLFVEQVAEHLLTTGISRIESDVFKGLLAE